MQYHITRQAPRCQGNEDFPPSVMRPSRRVACGEVLPPPRRSPSGSAPSPSDWDSQAARWRGARAGSPDGPRPLQAQAAGRLLLGDLLHPDQHRRGEGLLGAWLETDLVCRTPRLSVGLSLGDTVPTPRAPARPAPFTRAGRRLRVRGGGGLTWRPRRHLNRKTHLGSRRPQGQPHTAHARTSRPGGAQVQTAVNASSKAGASRWEVETLRRIWTPPRHRPSGGALGDTVWDDHPQITLKLKVLRSRPSPTAETTLRAGTRVPRAPCPAGTRLACGP